MLLADGAMADSNVPDTYVPPPPVYVTSTHETTQFGGATRIYDLSIPVDYDKTKAYPLVLSFHGNPGTADGALGGAFDSVSQTNAIVAYPQALAVDGTGFDWAFDLNTSNPDMQFINALITLLAGQYNIDTTKVYGFGFSGGGFFANMLACQFPSTMRGFASHAGGAPYSDINTNGQTYPGTDYPKCVGEEPVAALIVHGMDDTEVEYSSGTFEETYWSYVNGCSSSTTATTPSPCVTNNGCGARTPVEFCGIPGLGHGVWSEGYATSWAFFLSLAP